MFFHSTKKSQGRVESFQLGDDELVHQTKKKSNMKQAQEVQIGIARHKTDAATLCQKIASLLVELQYVDLEDNPTKTTSFINPLQYNKIKTTWTP